MPIQKKLLYSYVVDHDYGDAPNPYFGMCTLVKCKYSKDGKKNNLIESIYEAKLSKKYKEVWVVGTGGCDLTKSSGTGTILYAMKVDEAITVEDYYNCTQFRFKRPNHNSEFEKLGDNDKQDCGKYALISYDFYYYGNKKLKIPEELKKQFPNVKLEKKNRGFKFRKFTDEFIDCLIGTLRKETFAKGMLGSPCATKVFEDKSATCNNFCGNKTKKNANRPSPRRC